MVVDPAVKNLEGVSLELRCNVGEWADPGESPAEATVREVYEESGYRTRAVKLVALYDRSRHGHAIPQPLAQHDDIGLDAVGFESEQVSGSAEV